jgi:hypothetical protein
MEVTCPTCGLALTVGESPAPGDLLVCRSCGSVWLCEQGKDAEDKDGVTPRPLPNRVRFERQGDSDFTITASILQPAAAYLVLFFLVCAYCAVRTGVRCDWILFILSVAGAAAGAAMCLEFIAGRFRLAVRGGEGRLDEGFAGFHRTRSFPWADVVSVDQHVSRRLKMSRIVLNMKDGRQVFLGSALPEDRLRAVLQLLRYMVELRCRAC